MKTPLAGPRLFSVEEANRTLPLVSRIVSDIVTLSDDLDRYQVRLEAAAQSTAELASGALDFTEWDRIQEEIDSAEDQMEEFAAELAALGVELQDMAIGEIDFPTQIEGQNAYLCWCLGEPVVSHWHPEDAGFEDRQLLFHAVDAHEFPSEEASHS
ncbi:MAG: DUF2203 domain-containing protein [Planctomycetaceae bacterium]|nr:DUF2203 domain-containing protein [Planctomycetaceae bacterium]